MPRTNVPRRPIHPNPPGPSTCVVSLNGIAVGTFPGVSGLEAGARSVILTRGRITNGDFFTWLKASRYGTADPRPVTVTVLDGARRTVVYARRNARPSKWTGPMLAATGGGDVAMEELVLAHEGIEEE